MYEVLVVVGFGEEDLGRELGLGGREAFVAVEDLRIHFK